jgi:hypothetical protein
MELENKHKFDHEFVCIKCALEVDPFTRKQPLFYTSIKRIRRSNIDIIKNLEDLNLDPRVTSTAYELYLQIAENKIHRTKMHKIILCACICKAYGEECDVHPFLCYFNISEKDYKKGIKKINF